MDKVMSEFKAGKLKSGGDKTVTKENKHSYRSCNGTKAHEKNQKNEK